MLNKIQDTLELNTHQERTDTINIHFTRHIDICVKISGTRNVATNLTKAVAPLNGVVLTCSSILVFEESLTNQHLSLLLKKYPEINKPLF